MFPLPCLHNCTCYSSPKQRANIFNCQNKGFHSLPATILQDTDHLLLSGNNLGFLNKAPDYLNNITLLNLSSNKIRDIDETVMEVIVNHVKSFDIRKNKLKYLPKLISKFNKINKLWMSDNPYECNCDMIWMKDWLVDTVIVPDKKSVTCSAREIKGEITYLIYSLFNNLLITRQHKSMHFLVT